MQIKEFLKNHQQTLAILVGYVLVASLSFGLGRFTQNPIQPEIKVEEAFNLPLPNNYSANINGLQTSSTAIDSNQNILNCEGKIKGSSSKIYHVPGGTFYSRTTQPIRCFETEAQARAAGFRKSSK